MRQPVCRATSTARTRISWLEGSLGQGQLGRAFMGRYRGGGVDRVARTTDQWVGRPADLSRAGRQGVETYVRTDDTVGRDLRALS
ncbi:MAG: hypothetical protein GEV28_05590 [Actinophytocola sp.]|uniref:hypothetical protein n=1 Tax=Actinophytocola sp. TaxID=1872138 RepID=UPI0013255265|nr:hypothetical protein [Actinophytocola sp.]MPZ79886.1 hypothetical protein [Actinophytocola sp.]